MDKLSAVITRAIIRVSAGVALLYLFGTALADTQWISIPDTGWNLWLDKSARWKDEPVFFSGDSPISAMPVHPPTYGWAALGKAGVESVTLPTTVEQHFWGVNGLRPYQNEYFYESSDAAPRNGNYLGVSWWWRNLDVPRSFSGKTVILHTIPGMIHPFQLRWLSNAMRFATGQSIPARRDGTAERAQVGRAGALP